MNRPLCIDEYLPVDLQCKRLPCPFATEDGICVASSCLKEQFITEEEFWINYNKTVIEAIKIINKVF